MEALAGEQSRSNLGEEVLEGRGIQAVLSGFNHRIAGSSSPLIEGSGQLAGPQMRGLHLERLVVAPGVPSLALRRGEKRHEHLARRVAVDAPRASPKRISDSAAKRIDSARDP